MNTKRLFPYLLIVCGSLWLTYRVYTGATPLSLDKNVIGTWIAALLTLAVYSFLYKDNPIYKLVESIFIGISAAYFMIMGFWSTIMTNCIPKIFPAAIKKILPGVSSEVDYTYVIVLILGFMLLLRLTNRFQYWSKWALAYVVGYAAAMNLLGYLISDFSTQIRSSIVPFIIVENGTINFLASFSAIILITGTLASLIYFFYSKEHKGSLGTISRYGIWILMITFGASFGYTVMGRIALLIGRTQFLLKDWLKVIN